MLDQFSRNVYRGAPLSYSQDEKALQLAVGGIDAGMDRELTPMERIFFWMPLAHSEDLALQERVVRHQEEEAANTPTHLREMAMIMVGVVILTTARWVINRAFGVPVPA